MSEIVKLLTPTEMNANLNAHVITDDELLRMRDLFDSLPYESNLLSESDIKELKRLIPELDINQVIDSEVKLIHGACQCGRHMNLLDIVIAALNETKHSVHFLEKIFNGVNGRFVIVGYRYPTVLTDDFKSRMPLNTIYIKDVSPIPCKNCGIESEVILFQKNILHFWIQ